MNELKDFAFLFTRNLAVTGVTIGFVLFIILMIATPVLIGYQVVQTFGTFLASLGWDLGAAKTVVALIVVWIILSFWYTLLGWLAKKGK